MNTRDTIIEAAARALWVSAYMDHVEGDDPDSAPDLALACPFGDPAHPRPGAGEDWMDFAPPTGNAARVKARELIDQIEARNACEIGAHLAALMALWAVYGKGAMPEPEKFGHYLAMEALGHGVSWADDHAGHCLKIPHIEFYL